MIRNQFVAAGIVPAPPQPFIDNAKLLTRYKNKANAANANINIPGLGQKHKFELRK